MIVDTILLAVFFLLSTYAAYAIYAARSGAPFLPMSHATTRAMIQLAELHDGEQVIDLGSGDGRLIFCAGKQGIQATGIELHPLLYGLSVFKRFFVPYKQHIRFIRENLWHSNVSQADVVMLFFIKHKMPQLQKKLQAEMKPGSRVVSYMFTFPDWQYEKKDGSIYVYRVS